MNFSFHISYKNFVCLSHLHACYIPNPYHSVPAVSKVTRLGDERHGVQIPERHSSLSVVKSVQTFSGVPPPQQPLPVGTAGSFLEGKSAGT